MKLPSFRVGSALAGSEPPEFVTVEEAAERLNLSVATVRRRCSTGELAAEKPGTQWLVRASALTKAGPQRRRARPSAVPTYDLELAISHVRATDLTELWVPDVLRYRDFVEEPSRLVKQAGQRLEAFTFGPAVRIDLPKTQSSNRPGVLLDLVDRVAFQAVVATMQEPIEARLSVNVYSARKSKSRKYFLEKGTARWVKFKEAARKAAEAREVETWIVSADVSGYFEHILHSILFDDLTAIGIGGPPLRALRAMVSRWALVPGLGLPQGPNASRVLGNFYFAQIDSAMSGSGYQYFRYMDDVRIVADSKPQAVSALRELERLCRLRGLTLSSGKTFVKTLAEYESDEDDRDLDDAEYFFKHTPVERSRSEIKKILNKALEGPRISERRARFSIWRLAKLRERDTIPKVLRRLEDLAPVASPVAAYLKNFISRENVRRGISEFLQDGDRSYSTYLRTWIYAAMLERKTMPEDWRELAAADAMDRNNPNYLRSVAICVVARAKRRSDIEWIKNEVDREHDPLVLRALVVALHYARSMNKVVGSTVATKNPEIEQTLGWLSGRRTLPSLLYADQVIDLQT